MRSWRDHTAARRTRPPQLRGVLARPRVAALLDGARVLLVVAPAGSGKTTALAAQLAELGGTCWLSLDADDADPATLAASLTLALEALPASVELADLMDAGASPQLVVRRAADLLVASGALLVVDEAHLLGTPALAGLAHELLAGPRLALLSRTLPPLRGLRALEVRGELRQLGPNDLAFTLAETRELLTSLGVPASPAVARRAQALTEGWPIALRWLAQALAGGQVRLAALAADGPELHTLFAYLAQELLEPLPAAQRDFLTRSAVFEELSPALLSEALDEPQAGAYLEELAASGTFLSREAGGYRAHGLLRAQLLRGLDPLIARQIAARGARHFEARGEVRQAVAAHLTAGDVDRAGALLEGHGAAWLAQGRLNLLDRLLAQLPGAVWAARPALHALLGDVRRLQSRYPEALRAYAAAPDPAGLLGRVRVYLDTVQPALAAPLLERLAGEHPPLSPALAPLRAENRLNAGDLTGALQCDPALAASARYALRRGNLDRALAGARAAASGERGGARAAGNHREALLLQSLVCALRGELDEAEASARAGLAEGERLESPFVQSLAQARLGHARLAAGDAAGARAAYGAALELAADLDTPRLACEPRMGLSHLDAAEGRAGTQAAEALAVSQSSGDRYMTALVRLLHGLGLLQGGCAAEAPLRAAQDDFQAVGDAFGQAACALALFAAGEGEAEAAVRAAADFPQLLACPGLFAPFRERARRAALLARLARARPDLRARLQAAAHDLGYAAAPLHHPGETVRVQLLGQLALWRGGQRVHDWGRARARDLLALLVLSPQGQSREALIEALYPEADPQDGERNFRSVLHALGALLEGTPEAQGFFLERGEWPRLRPGPDLRVDFWEARAWLLAPPGCAGRAAALEGLPTRLAALDLPQAEEAAAHYAARLPEALGEEAALALAHGQEAAAARLAAQALAAEPAFEPAARLLMRAQHALGDRLAARRTYAQLQAALADLGLTPLPDTAALAETLHVSG